MYLKLRSRSFVRSPWTTAATVIKFLAFLKLAQWLSFELSLRDQQTSLWRHATEWPESTEAAWNTLGARSRNFSQNQEMNFYRVCGGWCYLHEYLGGLFSVKQIKLPDVVEMHNRETDLPPMKQHVCRERATHHEYSFLTLTYRRLHLSSTYFSYYCYLIIIIDFI